MQTEISSTKVTWDPMEVFKRPADYKYAVVILNRPILWKHESVRHIWEEAQITVTVDGGTHRWLNYWKQKGIDILSGEYTKYIPNLVVGDMDSCCPMTLEKLKTIGSTVTVTPNQNLTDYSKALLQLREYAKLKNIDLNQVYVFVETSGRFDHIIGNINTLYKSDSYIGDAKIIQIASNSLTWILKSGFHSIKVPEVLMGKNCWCGLLPFGSTVNSITTTGLRWNLDNGSMEFGGLVSTSNIYGDSPEITIYTDTTIIWSMGVEPLVECLHNYTELENSFENGI